MYNYLEKNREYINLNLSLEENPRLVFVRNICDNAKVFFTSTFSSDKKLIVLPDERSAVLFYEDYKFYDKDVEFFNERDLLFDITNYSEDIDKNRMNIIKKMGESNRLTVITTISCLLEKYEDIKNTFDTSIKLKVGDKFDFDSLIYELTKFGYSRTKEIEVVGEFAVRGGIIDIYEYTKDNPIRLEFFDDEIVSIRYFDVLSKRSIEVIDFIEIFPLKFQNEKKIGGAQISLLDFLGDDYLVFLDEPRRLLEKIDMIINMISESILNRSDDEMFKEPQIFSKVECLNKLTMKNCIQMSSLDDEPYRNEENVGYEYTYDFMMMSPTFNKNDLSFIYDELAKYQEEGFSGNIVLNSHLRAERVALELNEKNINAFLVDLIDTEVKESNIGIYTGELSSGFIDYENKFYIFTEKDLYDIKSEKRRKRIKRKHREGFIDVSNINELEVGDYVVHEVYGVGIYRGLFKIKTDNVFVENIKIEYADGGILYVPCTKLEVIQKYASSNAEIPRLNKLAGNDFKRTKEKVRRDVFEKAKELVELYAVRSNKRGFKYSEDNIWQKEFEETFPYIETDDQLDAIMSVKEDMESDKIMDRLICGDVGFGKTEVAIRAAFKAVQDGKQVAYLVPTTVLCMQHYNTFKDRFEKYPIKVDFLSRFKTKSENSKTIIKLLAGEIDIVIGTHRLLSEDIKFNNLGLLIIDEEQRFGVTHKEKIKMLKKDVDVLSLSATPIPRTLYMSLMGIRDMSLLTEAPPERMPIKTYVLPFNEELIREAISRELKRDGQVFIVHNRVRDIYRFAERISTLCPYANIGVGHGALTENELSNVMFDFINRKTNVLITTTIIETGLDIQNANTLIVDESENFGLSQLYQLRGRVGRSNRTAYAFFMYKDNSYLKEKSEKRLKTIKEFSALGSGIKIAMKDLEIRGAGNLLGISQSGHITQVGYDMYIKMLNEAVKYIKENEGDIDENEFVDSFDTLVIIDIDAYIPETYIDDEDIKFDVYKKISKAETEEEFEDLKVELKDRFGNMPKELDNLFFIAKLKIKAHSLYITKLTIKEKLISITFFEHAKVDGQSIIDIAMKFNGALRVLNGDNVTLTYKTKPMEYSSINKMLNIANTIIDGIKNSKPLPKKSRT